MLFCLLFFMFTALFLAIAAAFSSAGFPGSSFLALIFYLAAASDFYMGVLYGVASIFQVNPGWMFKDVGGRIRRFPRYLGILYIFFEKRAWRKWRRKKHEPIFEKVIDGLYLGSRVTEADVDPIRQEGIKAVLDMMCEFAAPERLLADKEIVYLCLPVLDGTAPPLEMIGAGARFIANAMAAGRPVLVHCTFGHGRSAAVSAAALMHMGKAASAAEALAKLETLSRKIWLSREQHRVLRKYERRLGTISR